MAPQVEALNAVSAPEAAIVYSAEPLWGALIASLLLGETFGGATWMGAALIIGGSLLGQARPSPAQAAATAASSLPPVIRMMKRGGGGGGTRQ